MDDSIPPPEKRFFSLVFKDNDIESKYRIFVRQNLADLSAWSFIIPALIEAVLLLNIYPSLTMFESVFLSIGIAAVFFTGIALLIKPKLYVSLGGVLTGTFTFKCIASCMMWGAVAGTSSVPPVVFFQFYFPTTGLPWYWSVISIALMLTGYFVNLRAEGGCVVDFTLILYSAAFIFITILTSAALDIAFRNHFAAVYVVSKYHDKLAKITEDDKHVADTLEEDNEMLKRALKVTKQVNDTMKKKTEEVERAMLAKEQFMATMSHEIRSPLHSIIAFSSLLLESTAMSKDDRSMVFTLNASSQHLMTIVNDILDFTRMQAQKTKLIPQNFHLHSFIDEIVGTMSPLVRPEVDLISTVNTLDEVELFGDCARLKQIICNLLSNASKFTHHGAIGLHVNVEPNAIDPSMAQLCITAEDTGIGMTKEYLDKMYTPFEQSANSLLGRYEGTGLGLVISKKLMEMFNGSIKCESTVNVGTKFTLELPLPYVILSPATRALHLSPSLLLPMTSIDAMKSVVYVLDERLTVEVQRAVKHWLCLVRATVLTEAEFKAKIETTKEEVVNEIDEDVAETTAATVIEEKEEDCVILSEKDEEEQQLDQQSNCLVRRKNAKGNRNTNTNNAADDTPLRISLNIEFDDYDDKNANGIVLAKVRPRHHRGATSNASSACTSVDEEPTSVTSLSHSSRMSSFSSIVLPGSPNSGTIREGESIIIDEKQQQQQQQHSSSSTPVADDKSREVSSSLPSPTSPVAAETPVAFDRSNDQIKNSVVFICRDEEREREMLSTYRRSVPPSQCKVLILMKDRASVAAAALKSQSVVASPTPDKDARSAFERQAHAMELDIPTSKRILYEMPVTGSSFLHTIVKLVVGNKETKRMDNALLSPVAKHQLHRSFSKVVVDADLHRLRILLVDDSAVNRKVGERLLTRCGITNVEFAENGQVAVDLIMGRLKSKASLNRPPFDVVLMDVNMPVIDGPTAAAEIVRLIPDMFLRPIVVACTADVFAQPTEAMHFSITKPFTAVQLNAILMDCFMELRNRAKW